MSTWPDLSALEVLVAVADHGSVGAAARSLGVAQANASRSIQRLERRLGVTLLERSTRGSDLTSGGTLVVEWARQVLDAATRLIDGAHALSSTHTAPLRVFASQTVAEHLLPRWIAAARRTHPSPVHVTVENSTEVAAAVRDGRADLGFVEGPGVSGGLHSTVVATDELVLVVASEHTWATRSSPVTLQELADTPLVVREAGSGTRVTLDTALGTHGPARPALEVHSNAAVRTSVAFGAAPAVLSRLAVADSIRRGELVEVPVSGIPGRRRLRAIWTGPRTLTGMAATLVDCARSTSPTQEGA